MKKLAVMALVGGTLLVAGCKRHQEPPAENNVTEAPAPVVAPEPQPAPVTPPKPVAETKPKPLPPTTEQQQVLDDADATGMTARVDRSANAADNQAADTHQQP